MKPNNLSMVGFLMSFKLLKQLSYAWIFTIGSSLSAQAAYKVHQIEAVYIFRIANFIQWADEDMESSLVFCGDQQDPVIQTLLKITTNKRIQGRAVSVYTKTLDRNRHCNIYVANSKTEVGFLQGLDNNILTISSRDNFTKDSGMIELRQVEGKVKPTINLDNLSKSPFKISSQLLRLSIIEGGTKP